MATKHRSISDWIAMCPDAIALKGLWQQLHTIGALRDASEKTLKRWHELAFAQATAYMGANPTHAVYVYNTLFTLFDANDSKQLLRFATYMQSHNALRTQQPA